MKAIVTNINGILIKYISEDGREGIDDSTYDEILTVNKDDVIELTEARIQELKEIDSGHREDLMRK